MAKAIAKEVGYFGVVRQPGDEFEVPDGTESSTWFDVVGDKVKKGKGKKSEAAEEPAADEAAAE